MLSFGISVLLVSFCDAVQGDTTKAAQTMLDVVGNNLANVNTVGYKSQSVEFDSPLVL